MLWAETQGRNRSHAGTYLALGVCDFFGDAPAAAFALQQLVHDVFVRPLQHPHFPHHHVVEPVFLHDVLRKVQSDGPMGEYMGLVGNHPLCLDPATSLQGNTKQKKGNINV